MSHPHPERLAALADGEPTAAEAAHLSSCLACAREIAAHRRLLMLAWQERDRLSTPAVNWDTIAAAAREEGLIRDDRMARSTAARSPWWLQAAAAVVILAGGMAIGRMSLPVLVGNMTASSDAAASQSGAQLVSSADTILTFRSTAEAISVLQRAEREYRMAMIFLSGQDSVTRVPDDPAIYRARLAAFDAIADVTLDAVREAPQDPVMNRYYLNAVGARDATLRQLGEKLPENVQLVGF